METAILDQRFIKYSFKNRTDSVNGNCSVKFLDLSLSPKSLRRYKNPEKILMPDIVDFYSVKQIYHSRNLFSESVQVKSFPNKEITVVERVTTCDFQKSQNKTSQEYANDHSEFELKIEPKS